MTIRGIIDHLNPFRKSPADLAREVGRDEEAILRIWNEHWPKYADRFTLARQFNSGNVDKIIQKDAEDKVPLNNILDGIDRKSVV
jgi:hypothetical protein